MRRAWRFALVGLAFASVTGVAQADLSVERSTPFGDYRQSADDEYTVSPGPSGGGNTGNQGNNNNQSGPNRTGQSPSSGTGPATGSNPGPQGAVSPVSRSHQPGASGVADTTAESPSRGLPFTGVDLLSLVLLGALLVAMGLLLAALARLRRRALAR